jgi:transcription initiation factor TFIID TATA-box-binding protein
MTDLKIENIVASKIVSDSLNIEQLSKQIPDSNYKPEEFNGLTIKLEKPKVAVLVLSSGKLVCTGAKNQDELKTAFNKVSNKLKDDGVIIVKKSSMEIINYVVSTDYKKEMHLSSISKGLLADNVSYAPEQFPGLIFQVKDSCVNIILFSSGKLVCTGSKSLEEASGHIKMMEEKLSSLGVL